ncbi:hypothetical protein BDR07DRAFT_360630 [Suillus spraguei]|nr:hypothetical protein BDR07DRAFT_360630 [Suillus spraguei]
MSCLMQVVLLFAVCLACLRAPLPLVAKSMLPHDIFHPACSMRPPFLALHSKPPLSSLQATPSASRQSHLRRQPSDLGIFVYCRPYQQSNACRIGTGMNTRTSPMITIQYLDYDERKLLLCRVPTSRSAASSDETVSTVSLRKVQKDPSTKVNLI